MQVQVVNDAPRFERRMRKPQFPFQVRLRPWALTPFHISAVLPGETLQNLSFQARAVSDPLKSKLGGWWFETYWFYVKHRDLPQRQELIDMHLTGAALTTNRVAAQSWPTYAYDNGIDWVTPCLQRVTEEYFRDQGETWNTNMIGSYPAIQTRPDGWWGDSLVDDSVSPPAVTTGNLLQDDPDLTVMSQYQTQYDRMRQMRLTDITFDDWLEMHGVKGVETIDSESLYKPELIRYTREWTYPTNTVEPTTGVPSSAAVWSIAERADKNRFIKEPGFLFAVCCARPKVFYSKQLGAAVGALDEARLWLPALMRDEAYTSVKQFLNTDVAGEGPFGINTTNGYWADMRDLFLYGDQFLNFDPTDVNDLHAPFAALPTAALQDRYAASTDADNLFTGATAQTRLIRVDGVVTTTIKGTVGADQT